MLGRCVMFYIYTCTAL